MIDLHDLYEHDFVRWTEEQARAIREGRLDALDREHLAEEIESMGNEERREFASRLTVLIAHLLKQRIQPELSRASWARTVKVQRRDIGRLIATSPSLKAHLDATPADVWQDAIDDASDETGIAPERFAGVALTLDEVLGHGPRHDPIPVTSRHPVVGEGT